MYIYIYTTIFMWDLHRTLRAGPLPISSKPMLRMAFGPCESDKAIRRSDSLLGGSTGIGNYIYK